MEKNESAAKMGKTLILKEFENVIVLKDCPYMGPATYKIKTKNCYFDSLVLEEIQKALNVMEEKAEMGPIFLEIDLSNVQLKINTDHLQVFSQLKQICELKESVMNRVKRLTIVPHKKTKKLVKLFCKLNLAGKIDYNVI